MLVGLESAYKQKDKTTSEDYIGEMQSNFLEGEPIIDFDYYYNFAKAIIPTITVDEVSALAKKHLNRKNMVIVAQGRLKELNTSRKKKPSPCWTKLRVLI